MIERRFGILIANSRFPKAPGLEDLRYPENDVDGLCETLVSKDRGGFHDLVVFKNRPRSEILHKLNLIFTSADKNDLILIYYSGHGKLNRVGRLHLATADTDLGALEATAISMGAIRELVDISATKKVVIILDCCYSGAVGDEFLRSSVDDQLQFASKGRGTYIMTASTEIQVATEKEVDQHGLFTKHLIQGIDSGDADLDHNGHISMDELYRYVHDRVLDESSQEPMKWDLNVRGDLIIARSGKTPRGERKQQLRAIIFDLAKEGLPDDILDKAREIIGLQPEQITGILRDYDHLLDQLRDQSIRPLEFISSWYHIRAKASDAEPPLIEARVEDYEAKDVSVSSESSKDRRAEFRLDTGPEAPKKIPNALGMEFVYIPPGTFTMGSPVDEPGRDDDEQQHEVTLTKGFYMQTTQVTQGQWKAVMGSNPSRFQNCGENCPVENVSWKDIQKFIARLNEKEAGKRYRLPTEAEWEYAARAGSTAAFANGGITNLECDKDPNLDAMGWYCGNSAVSYSGCYDASSWGGPKCAGTHPVAQKDPNAWGVYDMHGNVWEWCQDWHNEYPSGAVTDPKGPANGSFRVLRGGSWCDDARYCRSADCFGIEPGLRRDFCGFRLVLLPGQ